MERKRTESEKKLKKALAQIKETLVLVEGKRDKTALEALGCKSVLAVAGRKNQLRELVKDKKVIVMTDLDKPGNELAKMIRGELEGAAKVDCETRRVFGEVLKLKYFEDIKRKYEKFCEEGE